MSACLPTVCRRDFGSGPNNGQPVRIRDISRGGAALLTDWSPPEGQSVSVTVADLPTAIVGRVIRARSGVLAVAFGQDDANLALIDRALSLINAGARRAA